MLAKLRRLSKLNAPDENSADSGILAVRRGRAFEVAKGKLEPPIFRMVVVSDGEGDVDRIAGKKLGSLEPFRHVPAEAVERHIPAPSGVFLCRSPVLSYRAPVAPTDFAGVGMTKGSSQNCDCAEWLALLLHVRSERGGQLQLDVLVLEDLRRGHQAHGPRAEDRFRIALPEGFEAFQRLKQFRGYLLKIQFGIQIKDRFEIGGGEPQAGIFVEMGAQFGNAR